MFKFIGDLFLREKVYLNDKSYVSIRRGIADEVRGIIDAAIVTAKLMEYQIIVNTNLAGDEAIIHLQIDKKGQNGSNVKVKFTTTRNKRWYKKVEVIEFHPNSYSTKSSTIYKYNLIDAMERIKCIV
jgi:hypothetical protein